MLARHLAWLVPGLWFSVLATGVRALVLFAMEHLAHDSPLALVRHRLALTLTPSLLVFAALALVAALLAAATAHRSRPGSGRPAAALIAVALAVVTWLLLAGWIGGDRSRAVGLWSLRGQLVAGGLAAFALVGSFALVAWTRQRAEGHPGTPRALALPLVCALILGPGTHFALSGFSSEMPVRNVVARVTQIPDAWRITRARDDAPPEPGLLTPSIDYRLDGADMPALLLPPPAEVRIRVPDIDGLSLVGRAGLDRSAMATQEKALVGHTVRFTLQVVGGDATIIELPCKRVGRWPSTEWRDLGPGGAIPVPAGGEVILRTALMGPERLEVEWPTPLPAGFGGLTFEHRTTAPRTRSAPDRPNLVLIVMDTQRADRLSVYGYERATSPNLEALAERGTLFETAYSTASWTWPSTASILTGQLPYEHGVLDESSCFLADELDTLAESLQASGFTTAAFSANPLITPERNFDQGFELFDYTREGTRDSRIVIPPAVEWLEAIAGTRFFLYLHLADPHAPLDPLPEGRKLFAANAPTDLATDRINEHQSELIDGHGHTETGERVTERVATAQEQAWISDLYDASVWSGDYQVGQILATLERLGLTDETIVAFTSDHGEELYEHGFATHGQNVFGSVVRVPLILAGPGIAAGRRVSTPISNRHLAGSLAHAVGADPIGPEDRLNLIADDLGATREVLFGTEKGWWNGRNIVPIHGYREGNLVLHWAPTGQPWGAETNEPSGELRLYDLARDAGELRDLSRERPEDVARMQSALEKRLEELAALRAAPAIAAGEATLEMLRAIGYLEEE